MGLGDFVLGPKQLINRIIKKRGCAPYFVGLKHVDGANRPNVLVNIF